MTIGQNIKNIREKKEISQYKLSKICNMSQSYLNELEKGKYKNPSAKLLDRVAKALGVSIADLLDS